MTFKSINRLKYLFFLTTFLILANHVHADTFEKILKSEQLRVGVSLYEPWAFKDQADNLTGFEIELAKQLAKDMGVQPTFVTLEWSQLISALEAKQIDIIISGMAITPERALRVNFSSAYASAGFDVAASLSKTAHINSLNELNHPEITIGVVSNTAPEQLAKKMFEKATIKSFKQHYDVRKAILNGEIHAWFDSTPIPRYLALEYPDKVDTPLKEPLLGYKAGMAIHKGNQEFLNYLNSWITARDADRWISSRHKYWFESLDWKKK
ncbi:transporter substrate-binding domain-containing protein [Nitrosomonas sp. Nm84]|uniref:transporter substrate-binding domain-containing protein n=1 Tax=Nitrosomonas sp. Nm84 TaxID=200124 RepID=UPI0014043104|nr:transporter substrate-binding domain-containing protein [Nitrosomonas sp. Nm84]